MDRNLILSTLFYICFDVPINLASFKIESKIELSTFYSFDPSPYTRHTVWSVLFGSWLYNTSYIAVNQTMVQRYKSLPSKKISQL